MDELQNDLNREYKKRYEDTLYLTDEEIAQMAPKTFLDEEMFRYYEKYGEIKDIERTIENIKNYIVHCKMEMAKNKMNAVEAKEMEESILKLMRKGTELRERQRMLRNNLNELNRIFNGRSR